MGGRLARRGPLARAARGQPAPRPRDPRPLAQGLRWRECARRPARAAGAALRRGARLPGAVEVGGLGPAERGRARRRLGARVAARALFVAPRHRGRCAHRRRPRHRQEPRAPAAAGHRGGGAARVPAAVFGRGGGARRRRAVGLRPRRVRRPQPRRGLAEQALARRALWRAGEGAPGPRPAAARELGPGRGGPGGSRGRSLGRRRHALLPDDPPRLRRDRTTRPARRRGRHRAAAPRLRGRHSGGGPLRPDRPRAQRALRRGGRGRAPRATAGPASGMRESWAPSPWPRS
jgi:hypothetical protein